MDSVQDLGGPSHLGSCSQGLKKTSGSLGFMAPLKEIEYGVYRDLIIISPKPYSICLRGTTGLGVWRHGFAS